MDRFFVHRLDDGRALYLLRVTPDRRVFFCERGRWIERRGPYSDEDSRLRRLADDYSYKALYDPGTDYDELDAREAGAVATELSLESPTAR